MSLIAKEKEKLADFETAQSITSALRDISAHDLQVMREEYERNQTFYRELTELYHTVKAHALQSKQKITRRRYARIFAAVTSNKRFYGTLNTDVMETFLKNTEKNERCIVVGKTGKQYMEEAKERRRNCEFMLFEGDQPTEDDVLYFLTRTHAFDQVILFYPKFASVFHQETGIVDITYTPEESQMKKDRTDYIFEPDLPGMLEFFETQVRYLLFKRTMLETALARTAARLMRMDAAEHTARDMISKQERQLRKKVASLNSMRLLETFAGYTQWKE